VLAKFDKFPLNILHGDKHCCIITVWAQSLKTTS
jgi:hypothetical protein